MVREIYSTFSKEEAMGSLARALYEESGDKIIPFITSLFEKLGNSLGSNLGKKLEKGDFKDAATAIFSSALKAQPPRAEFLELADDKLILKAFVCRVGLYGAGKKLCQAIMEIDRGMLSQISGKKIDMQIDKSLAAGDNCCLIRFQVYPD